MDKLVEHLRSFDNNPFLFLGAGVSRRYVGGPSWEEVLVYFSKKCGKEYEFYRSSNDNDLLRIASHIAKDFHSVWWSKTEYKRSRERNKAFALYADSAFKIAICEYIKMFHLRSKATELDEELDLFRQATIDGVITTNYDTFIEELFPDFVAYVGQDQLIFNASFSIGEIYKIHGSVVDPNTIVITQEDYERFTLRSKYLASKLLTLFVEHPIIFFGYTLRDPNIHTILKSVIDCLDGRQIEKLRDRLIFIIWNPDAKAETFERTEMVIEGSTIPICRIEVPNYISILSDLSLQRRKIPVKVLRQMKQSVFEIVHATNPTEKIAVYNIEEVDDHTDLEYVVGIGVSEKLAAVGLKSISRDFIVEDFLLNDRHVDPVQFVNEGLPDIMKRADHVPFYKYLVGAKIDIANLEKGAVDPRIVKRHSDLPKCLRLGGSYLKRALATANDVLTPKQFIEKYGVKDFLYYYLWNRGLNAQTMSEFREALKEIHATIKSENSLVQSGFMKAVCYLDIMENFPSKMFKHEV